VELQADLLGEEYDVPGSLAKVIRLLELKWRRIPILRTWLVIVISGGPNSSRTGAWAKATGASSPRILSGIASMYEMRSAVVL